MKIIDNINSLLGEDLKSSIKPNARLKIAASCFSIYAYESLKTELEKVNSLEFIFTTPTFVPDEVTDKLKKHRREFFIPKASRENALYGSEFEIQLRNKLTQRAIARECAQWVRNKATFKSNKSKAQMQQFVCVQNADEGVAYRPTMRYDLLGVTPEKGQWRWEEDRAKQAVNNYQDYLNIHSKNLTLDEWYIDTLTATNEKLNFVRKNEEGVIQYYVPPSGGKLLSDNWMDITLSGNETIFDTEKSLDLLNRIIGWICANDQESTVLDFFAGSGTTADSVFRLNATDGGKRKFILVQIDELCSEKSEAKKAGYTTISQITKKRISDAGRKVLEDRCHENWNKDVGFRVLKIDTSNMSEVYYTPDGVKQEDLLAAVDNIKPDRTPEDLLFQVLLDWGVDLSLPITKQTIQGKTVFFVDGNALVACFDNGITEELVKELAAGNPLRVVFRDNGFFSDSVKINAEQIFKQMSPGTDVKAI